MKRVMVLMFASMLMVVAGPVWSDSVIHVLSCQQDGDTSDEQVEAISAEWLAAAKAIKGGENLELYLNFPVAAKAGEVDFLAVVVAPSFAEWGAFMDNYPGSAAAKSDDKNGDNVACGNGTLWESVKIE